MSHHQSSDSSQLVHIQLQLQQQQQQQQQYIQQHENDESKLKRYFYNRTQSQNETADEFLAELERLCRVARIDQEMPNTSVESIIRERFVLGLRDPQAQVKKNPYLKIVMSNVSLR